MIRAQFSLEEHAYREAKDEARRQGISFAEFLRRAVAQALTPRRRTEHPWMRYAGALSSGDRNASRSVDAAVYDRPPPVKAGPIFRDSGAFVALLDRSDH